MYNKKDKQLYLEEKDTKDIVSYGKKQKNLNMFVSGDNKAVVGSDKILIHDKN